MLLGLQPFLPRPLLGGRIPRVAGGIARGGESVELWGINCPGKSFSR